MKLDDFVMKEKSTKTCKVCLHPDMEEINRGWEKGYRYALIDKWLKLEGKSVISERILRQHFKDGHNES